MRGCSEQMNGQPCVGLAGPSGWCAVHAAGFGQVTGGQELRCEHCHRQLSARVSSMRMGADEMIDVTSPEYRAYHARVIAAIRERLFARWPPRTDEERQTLEQSVRFFDTECTYDAEMAEGEIPEEMADDQIDAAF